VTAGGVPSTVVSPYELVRKGLASVKSDLIRIPPRSVLRLLLFVDDHTRLVCAGGHHGRCGWLPLRVALSDDSGER
jgi:hypothetical protein